MKLKINLFDVDKITAEAKANVDNFAPKEVETTLVEDLRLRQKLLDPEKFSDKKVKVK